VGVQVAVALIRVSRIANRALRIKVGQGHVGPRIADGEIYIHLRSRTSQTLASPPESAAHARSVATFVAMPFQANLPLVLFRRCQLTPPSGRLRRIGVKEHIMLHRLLLVLAFAPRSRALRVPGLLVLSMLLAISWASPAKADTVYSYTGTSYGVCFGAYTTSCDTYSLTGTFDTTLSVAALESQTDFVIPLADIASFSFTDGFEASLNQGSTQGALFEITTDASGDITGWEVLLSAQPFPAPGSSAGPQTAILTENGAASTADVSGSGVNVDCTTSLTSPHGCALDFPGDAGAEVGGLGAWSPPATTATPEPSTLPVLGVGLLGLAVTAFRRKQV
jgi:PEP-CTERM motif